MKRYYNDFFKNEKKREKLNLNKVASLAELIGAIMIALLNDKNVIIIENDIINLFSRSNIKDINYFYYMISYWSEYKNIIFIVGDEIFDNEQIKYWL